MDKLIFEDNELKERKTNNKRFLIGLLVIVVLFLFACMFFYLQNEEKSFDYEPKYILIIAIFILSYLLVWEYMSLYSKKYRLLVYDDKIVKESLFGSITILYPMIKSYSYKKYSLKSDFYVFTLYLNKKRVSIYTRYYNEFIAVLKTKSNID